MTAEAPFSASFDHAAATAMAARASRAGAAAVRYALGGTQDVAELAALLSPQASGMLEAIAAEAHRRTVERFGKSIFLFAPLYLSNECVCTCTYCGFSMGLDIRRRTLRIDEIAREATLLGQRGIRNILLVSAEHPKRTPVPYVAAAIAATKAVAPYVGIEIAAAEEADYRAYVEAGCDGVVLYQETYDPDVYARHHLGGPKKRYAWRLDAPERAARAGVKHLGIGALLGLADWRAEAISLLVHARYLERRCWRAQLNVSLPRINPAAGGYAPAHAVTDRDFVQLLCFLRIALPTANIVLSTRETAALRDRLLPLGVTHMSAGSSTEPGGYGTPGDAGEQFELEDLRDPETVAAMIRRQGYDAIFKDWETMHAGQAATA